MSVAIRCLRHSNLERCDLKKIHLLYSVAFSLNFFAGITPSIAQDREYTEFRTILMQALLSEEGTASGRLVGQMAEGVMNKTGSSDPIALEVTTLHRFKQPGCKRLNLRMTQNNVLAKDGGKTELVVNYGLNLCPDGSPPSEGMDLSNVGKYLRGLERE